MADQVSAQVEGEQGFYGNYVISPSSPLPTTYTKNGKGRSFPRLATGATWVSGRCQSKLVCT